MPFLREIFFNVRILAPTLHVPKGTIMTLRLRAGLLSTLTALAGFAALPVTAQNPASVASALTASGRPANAAVTVKFDTAYTGDTSVEARDASAGSFSVAQFGAEIAVPLPPVGGKFFPIPGTLCNIPATLKQVSAKHESF